MAPWIYLDWRALVDGSRDLRKRSTSAPISFSPMNVGNTSVVSAIIASAIHVWHAALSIVAGGSTLPTTFMSSRYRKSCSRLRQWSFGQLLSDASQFRRMSKHSY
jgi:hypothetical protein